MRPVSHGERVITVRESVIAELRAMEAAGAFNDKAPPVGLGEVSLIVTGGAEMSARVAQNTDAAARDVRVEFLPSQLVGVCRAT